MEKDYGISYWYYPIVLIIIFIRMAQPIFSLFYLIVGLLLNNVDSKSTVYSYLWSLFDKSLTYCFELSSLFRWLVWISSIFKWMVLEKCFDSVYVLLMVFFNDRRLQMDQYSR